MLDSWAVRLAVKLIMGLSVALFWPPFMVIMGLVTAVFICVAAYFRLGWYIDANKFAKKYDLMKSRPFRP